MTGLLSRQEYAGGIYPGKESVIRASRNLDRPSLRQRRVGADELFACGMRLMADAERGTGVPDWRQAQRYRDGLMIALLAARPVRRGNFAAIEIDRHLCRRGAGYQLRFAPSETNRRPLDFPVPMPLVPRLERYLAHYRPMLCRRAPRTEPTMRLWVAATGTPLQEASLYARVVKLTQAAFGRPINPHLFRDCAATSLAIEDPAHVRITKDILGHSTLRTSERHYNHAQSLQATRRYQAQIHALRAQARAHHDQTSRKRFLKG